MSIADTSREAAQLSLRNPDHLINGQPTPSRPVASRPAASPAPRLRRVLVVIDSLALATAWSIALAPVAPTGRYQAAVVVALISLVGLASMWINGLYRSRVCARRESQREGTIRTAVMTALAATGLWATLGWDPTARAWLGAALCWALLTVFRGGFGHWLRSARTAGRYTRSVAVVGVDEEAVDLARLIEEHPEFGYRVVGLIGDRSAVGRADLGVPWLGELAQAPTRLRSLGIGGAIVVLGALEPRYRRQVVDQLWAAGIHVQASAGVTGLHHRRIRPVPVGNEPLFYLEAAGGPSAWQRATKRATDVVLGGLGLVAALPVLAASAVAIKIQDRGPVFFRQPRLGLDGSRFEMVKLRTMVPDADSKLAEVKALNDRRGPLFKASDDPRVTSVGRILRATSIDELPQLWNVIRGQMSLVGPRPALPREAASFDSELLATRLAVRPGITGLWQVEARDNPAYNAYRRLDMFYVWNWSWGLDVYILSATVGVVGLRGARAMASLILGPLRRRRMGPDDDQAPAVDLSLS